MCTDHARAASAPITATLHRVPLRRRPQPLTRRSLFHHAGIGTAGVAILAACAGSDGGASAPTETAVSAESSDTSAPTEEPATTEAAVDSAESRVDGEAADGPLELTWVELGFVSAYVLVRGNEAAIVDTGTSGSGEAINEALSALGLAPADVRHIILTHNHGDHAGGLGELEGEMTNAMVSAGPGDVDSIQTALALQEVADGDEVFGMGVVHTPGHTPGSISVFDTDTGLLVAGDAINGDGTGGITGPNERFSSDMPTANATVGKLAALGPMTAAFGHGGGPVGDDVTAKLEALVG